MLNTAQHIENTQKVYGFSIGNDEHYNYCISESKTQGQLTYVGNLGFLLVIRHVIEGTSLNLPFINYELRMITSPGTSRKRDSVDKTHIILLGTQQAFSKGYCMYHICKIKILSHSLPSTLFLFLPYLSFPIFQFTCGQESIYVSMYTRYNRIFIQDSRFGLIFWQQSSLKQFSLSA